MPDYNPARKEIKAAKRALELLTISKDFEEMEQCWRDCINHIEKSHTKLLSATSTVKSKFASKFSNENHLKRNDELLVYVNQARNADNHSISEITSRQLPSTEIGPSLKKDEFYVKSLVMKDGRIVHYEGDPINVKFNPGSIVNISVVNYGKTYHPPKHHLGIAIDIPTPIEIAERAIAFHEKWIEDSSRTFT